VDPDTDLAVQEAVRAFVDAEVRPIREELEFGDLPPYDVLRKLWRSFGIDVMLGDAAEKMLAKERARRDIEIAKRAALQEIYGVAAAQATAVATKILEREVTAADQQRLVDESLRELQTVKN
jgi:hypothetical protein